MPNATQKILEARRSKKKKIKDINDNKSAITASSVDRQPTRTTRRATSVGVNPSHGLTVNAVYV